MHIGHRMSTIYPCFHLLTFVLAALTNALKTKPNLEVQIQTLLVLLAQLVQDQMLNYDTLCSLLCAALCLVSRSKKIGAGPTKKEYAELQHIAHLTDTVRSSKPFCLVSSSKKVGAQWREI